MKMCVNLCNTLKNKQKPMNLIFQIEVMIYMLLQKIFLFGLKSKVSKKNLKFMRQKMVR